MPLGPERRVRPAHTWILPVVLGLGSTPLAPAAPIPQDGALDALPLDELFRAPKGKPRRVSSTNNDLASNADFLPLAAGAEMTLARLKGSGTITRMWLTIESSDPYYPRLIVLRAKWDDETTPSIEVPIGDFFGVGHGLEAEVDTLPIQVRGDGRARTSYWPMPFNESAEITLRNDSGIPARLVFWVIDWVEGPGGRPLHAHFRASSRDPTQRQHKVAEISGSGIYVGTVLSIWSSEEGWPGEGDDRVFIDGGQTPTFAGIGLEGYFDEAWGFRVGDGPFGGVTVHEGTGAGARTTACRWHLRDPIPFAKSFALTFERSGYALRNSEWQLVDDRRDSFSSVAFWYQSEPHESLPVLPTQRERLPFFEVRIEPEEKDALRSITVPEAAPVPKRVDGSFWAYGGAVYFAPDKIEHGKLALPFDVPAPREYDLYLRLTRGLDGGVWQLFIDGEPFGSPIDLFAPRTMLLERLLGRLHLKPGGHELELRCTGKNLESTGYALGFDSFMARWYP